MELTDLAHRISTLERQLAAARWRERAVYASAILIGLVFACKSSTATDDKPEQPQRLVIGGVTIDHNGITIDGLAASITVLSKSGGGERRTTITAGEVLLGTFENESSRIRLEAHGLLARIETSSPPYKIGIKTGPDTAGLQVEKTGTVPHRAWIRVDDMNVAVDATVDRHVASLFATTGNNSPRSEVGARASDKSVRMVNQGGKPEIQYEK